MTSTGLPPYHKRGSRGLCLKPRVGMLGYLLLSLPQSSGQSHCGTSVKNKTAKDSDLQEVREEPSLAGVRGVDWAVEEESTFTPGTV